jgi:hypothetical protein
MLSPDATTRDGLPATEIAMPRVYALAPEDEQYLKRYHNHHSFVEMAKRLRCDVVTVKRILVKLGLRDFENPKFYARRRLEEWSRPCLRCRDDTPRPKNQYVCDRCHDRDDMSSSSMADDNYCFGTR